jgi:glycogen debranching enzyme
MPFPSIRHEVKNLSSGGQYVVPPDAEWIEADGRGGFAMGTVCGTATRRYHALLQPALTPPTGRVSIVQGMRLRTAQGVTVWPLTPEVPAGQFAFNREPWPSWTLRVPGDGWLDLIVFSLHDSPYIIVRIMDRGPVTGNLGELALDLEFTGRDYHGPLLKDPPVWECRPAAGGAEIHLISAQPPDVPPIPPVRLWTTGIIASTRILPPLRTYVEETRRGLDDMEQPVVPVTVEMDLSRMGNQVHWLVLCPGRVAPDSLPDEPTANDIRTWSEKAQDQERRRRQTLVDTSPDWLAMASRATGFCLQRSADQFLVRRGQGYSILAGFPWFTDWGRDTFIAMRGLLMACGRWDIATAILLEWAQTVSEGMVPNFFPDQGSTPEYNSVDASLWYCVCAGELLAAAEREILHLSPESRSRIQSAVTQILTGYRDGTRYGIGMDPEDGLLRAGAQGWQLTWMDARSDGREVTPRIGKPVEIQALWYNALLVGAKWDANWAPLAHLCRTSFVTKFPDPATGGLVDVVDENHVTGEHNRQVRPNQIFAVGGLPEALLDGPLATGVVELTHRELWTPMGLRTLSPRDPEYCPTYNGNRIERDARYHQGTVWAWLAGPFIEACLRVRPGREGAQIAEADYLRPLEFHLRGLGLGHITEVADGDHPHARGGCPAQAWSLGEYLRVRRLVNAILHPETVPE